MILGSDSPASAETFLQYSPLSLQFLLILYGCWFWSLAFRRWLLNLNRVRVGFFLGALFHCHLLLHGHSKPGEFQLACSACSDDSGVEVVIV